MTRAGGGAHSAAPARSGAAPRAGQRSSIARGGSLDVLALQQNAGNQAVRRLLGASGFPAAEDTIGAAVPLGEGATLDPLTRGFMEERFGTDLGDVRVHHDRRSQEMADTLNAEAYTVGPHIVFGPGRYAPHQHSGRELLAHELAHVIQQRGAATTSGIVPAGSPAEHAADAAAAQALSGVATVHVAAAGSMGLAMKRKARSQEWYQTAFHANRAFATHFRSKVPAGWPYSDDLKKLWDATKVHWKYDEAKKEITEDGKAASSAIPFIEAVREFQITTLGASELGATGVLDGDTAKALSDAVTKQKAAEKKKKEDAEKREEKEHQERMARLSTMEFDISGGPGSVALTTSQANRKPNWVETKQTALSWDVITSGFTLYFDETVKPLWIPARFIRYDVTNARAISEKVYRDIDQARADIAAAPKAGDTILFAYYLTEEGIVLPTLICPASTPVLIARMRAHLGQISKDVQDALTGYVVAAGISKAVSGAGNYVVRKSQTANLPGTKPAKIDPPPPPRGRTPVDPEPPPPPATPIEKGREYRQQRQPIQQAQPAVEDQQVPLKKTGTGDPRGSAQQPAPKAIGTGGGGDGGGKTAPPPSPPMAGGGDKPSHSAPAAPPQPAKKSSRGIPVKNQPPGPASNDNAAHSDQRKKDVADIFNEAQAQAKPADVAAEGTHQNVSKIPGAKQPPRKATGGTWAHDNFESIEKVTKPNAERLVSEKLPPNLEKEHRIPVKGLAPANQPRADRVDWKEAEVLEIKPSKLKELGETEAKGYADLMNKYEKRTDGKQWTGRCVTYDETKVMKFLDDIGYFEKPKATPIKPKGKK